MDVKNFVDEKIAEIKAAVGQGKAISALSGGVDSSVCTILAHRAIGDNLKTIFIDDGLMRENEPQDVQKIFGDLGITVDIVDARSEFFEALKGKDDPEDKRKAFRNTFYSVFGREVKRSESRFLIQGTIKADIIETQVGIKTQHNILKQIGIDPEEGYGFKVMEPVRDLYKPQVRKVAAEVGLTEKISQRMPFPGPGLATRVVGEVTEERVELLRKATTIVEDEIAGLKPFQAFAVLLSDRGTGIVEGERAYGDIIIVRSVESTDAMTAQPTQVPWDILMKVTHRITTELPRIVRVAYELTPKPPATIEYV